MSFLSSVNQLHHCLIKVMTYNIRSGAVLWQIPNFLSDRNSNVCYISHILTSKRLKMQTNTISITSEVRYFPMNCATANAVHDDPDLHFRGHEFGNVNISKTVSANEKCSIMTFIEVEICHRMGPLRMLYSTTFT